MEALWSILAIVLEITAPVLAILLAWIGKKIVDKYNLENNAAAQRIIDDIVKRAVFAVEQIADVAEKEGEALSSSDKLSKAIAFIETEMRTLKLPELLRDILVARIEAALYRNQPLNLI